MNKVIFPGKAHDTALFNGKPPEYYLSRPNLLTNWYFADLINQTGQTELTITNIRYAFDCWRTTGNVNASKPMTITFGNKCIDITCDVGAGLTQFIENYADYAGRTLTASFLAEIVEGRYMVAINDGSYSFKTYESSPGIQLCSFTKTISASPSSLRPLFDGVGVCHARLYAAKMEICDHQTLARQDADGEWVLLDSPPDKGAELERCQRRQYRLETNLQVRMASILPNTYMDFWIPLTVTMRIKPVIRSGAFMVRSVSGDNQTGFTFEVAAYADNGVLIRARKSNHGLMDGYLVVSEPVLLDSNL